VGVTADVPLASGPADLGYPQLALLERGMKVTPLELYGDFARVVGQVGDLSAEGWLPLECLERVPQGLPELAAAQVPWLQDAAAAPDCPFLMDPQSDEYAGAALFGSAATTDHDLRLDVSLKISLPEPPATDIANGILLVDALDNPHWLFFGHVDGQWRMSSMDQGTPRMDHLLKQSSVVEGRAWLLITGGGKVIRYGLPDGTEGEVDVDRELFPASGFVRVHVQVAPHSSLEIRELVISHPPTGKRESDPARSISLRELALKRGITYGTTMDMHGPRDEQVLRAQAGLLTWNLSWRGETELYPGSTQASASQVSFAKANGMQVRAHTLIGGPSDLVPDWLKNGRYSAEEVGNFTREWITGLVSRYQAVDEWVVVNESLGAGAQLDNNIWNRRLGAGYIDQAFRWAREANPKTRLIINEAEVDRPGARLRFYVQLVRQLLDGGAPVDGIGSQFHLKAVNAPSKQELLDALGLLGSLGLGVHITELDVNLYGLSGTQQDKWARQAEIYRDVVEAALESGVVRNITTWDLSDKYSWLTLPEFQFMGGGEAPLIFDEEYRPKPAFYAMVEALRG
jgi:endo-1,4-beta-xylanase